MLAVAKWCCFFSWFLEISQEISYRCLNNLYLCLYLYLWLEHSAEAQYQSAYLSLMWLLDRFRFVMVVFFCIAAEKYDAPKSPIVLLAVGNRERGFSSRGRGRGAFRVHTASGTELNPKTATNSQQKDLIYARLGARKRVAVCHCPHQPLPHPPDQGWFGGGRVGA